MTDAEVPPTRAAMGKGFRSLGREHGFVPLEVEGRIPEGLEGTLYKNGPAVFECEGSPYCHWLDGDGAITAVRFAGGAARGAVRVTMTNELREERKAGRMLYGSGFTKGPIWRKRLLARAKNPTNIHVLVWQRRLFAMAEMGLPYELHPDTLETIGRSNLGGVARQATNAHVRLHPNGDIYAIGPYLGMSNALDVLVLPPSGPARRLTSIPLRSPALLIHDFTMSERHLVFIKPPMRVRVAPLMLGIGTPMDALSYHPEEGCQIIVLPLDGGEPIFIQCPAFVQLHQANAFQDGPELLVDVCCYPKFDLGTAFMLDSLRSGAAWVDAPVSSLQRLRIDLTRKEARLEPLWAKNCDFPCTAPSLQGKRARYVWASVTRDHVDRVTRVDLQTGEERECQLEPHEISGEPTFVPRPGGSDEDDGWILTQGWDAKREVGFVAVLDARDPSHILARARFDHHIPLPLHGTFMRGI